MTGSYDFDFIVVGSGFGGSVSAHRLTEKGYTVAVMEMGRRWTPETLPRTNWNLRRWIFRPSLGLRGFFNIRLFRHVLILHGCAVGGGSITYANTSLAPGDSVWKCGSWAGLAPWQEEMPLHYATARRMLGIAENRILGVADHKLREAAEAAGVGHTFYRTHVAVLQAPEGEEPGRTVPDPYFGGEGPERATCIACGGCMVGCRYNAKNTLDKNYLYLAEKHGARVFPETRVVDVRPFGEDGGGGYEVHTVDSLVPWARNRRRFTARGVVFSASALGTMDLLFRLKHSGSLPRISERLGKGVRTNAESLIGVRVAGGGDDLSKGVAIGSGIYLDECTHIEATRYPAGSDAMAVMCTLLTGGRPGWTRILLWLRTMTTSFLLHPVNTIRCLHPFGWAKESLIMLTMQTLEGSIEMRPVRRWYWPLAKKMATRGRRVPTFIPQANDFVRGAARLMRGTAMSMVTEVLFDVPGTAHMLGGCPMGASSAEGVVDARNRVFGYRNLYVCDGSVISANLGVNPSLTICALTERAMSHILPAAETCWDDAAVEHARGRGAT
jgi:cholesterol oxidase